MNTQLKKGFTLVELLVVMAIIAILASIVVPNVIDYIRKARATRTYSEIQGMELALTKMLADANRNSLHELFDQAFWAPGGPWRTEFPNPTPAAFESASKIYTSTFYALLRSGRAALTESDPTDASIVYAEVLDESVIAKLGTNYMEVGLDPYDKRYNIFPGPYRGTFFASYPIIFRNFANDQVDDQLPGTRNSGGKVDALTVEVIDPATDEERVVGFTAPTEKMVYIWSVGQNGTDDQALNAPGFVSGGEPGDAYETVDQGFWGGGDDINNWDNDRTWERLYN